MKNITNRAGLALGLGLVMTASLIGLTGCVTKSAPVSDASANRSTLKSDDHAVPVYTSPTNDIRNPKFP